MKKRWDVHIQWTVCFVIFIPTTWQGLLVIYNWIISTGLKIFTYLLWENLCLFSSFSGVQHGRNGKSMCMYVRVYMPMCMYVRVYIPICMYVCIYGCVWMYVYVCIYGCVCMYVYNYVCVYVCMCICMYVYMYVCVYGCMYVYVGKVFILLFSPRWTLFVYAGRINQLFYPEKWLGREDEHGFKAGEDSE